MMEGFAEDILNFAMIKSQTFRLSFAIFSLSDVMKYIKETFSMKAESKGINLDFIFAENLSHPIPLENEIPSESELVRQAKAIDREMQNLTIVNRSALPKLNGDERRLKQVIMNLVKNALKFTTNGSISVALAYQQEQQMLIGHVRDSGVGIARHELSKLFTRFGKVHRTAEMNHEGIGLGLTIVKEIVSHCDGSIDVLSTGVPGRGSTFRFSMKIKEASN